MMQFFQKAIYKNQTLEQYGIILQNKENILKFIQYLTYRQ